MTSTTLTTLAINVILTCVAAGVIVVLGLALRRAAGHDPVLRYRILIAHLLALGVLLPLQVAAPFLDIGPRGQLASHLTPALPEIATPLAPIPINTPSMASAGAPVAMPAPATDAAGGGVSRWGVLGLIYLAGVAASLVMTGRRARAAAAILCRASLVNDPRVLSAWKSLCGGSSFRGLARRARLLESPALSSPACTGLLRPAVLLPSGFSENRRDETIRCALHHEIVHLRRADHLIAMLHSLIAAIFWPQPLLRRFGRALEEDREASCDAIVVRATGRVHEYAAALIECCTRSPVLSVSMASGPPLRRRILMLTHAHVLASPLRARLVGGVSALAIVSLLTATGLIASAAAPVIQAPADRTSIEVKAPGGERQPQFLVELLYQVEHAELVAAPAPTKAQAISKLVEQETIAWAKDGVVTGTQLTAAEISLSLPEGSNLRAMISGDKLSMQPGKDGSHFSLSHAEVKIFDRNGVNRATVTAVDPDATMALVSKEENGEYNFVVQASRNGESSKVQIRWDSKTGKPEGEKETPPGQFRFYTIDATDGGSGNWELRMQWCHELISGGDAAKAEPEQKKPEKAGGSATR